MNITQSTKGDNLISIKISVVKEDYQEALEKSLKQLRHRANVPGFRPGMVPMGMIKKMYGASAKMEALNTVVSENLNKHIFDNKLDLLGYPLSDTELQKPADLEKEDDMDFYFEAALRPEINIDFTNTMVDFYHIVPTDEEVDKVIEDLLQRNPNTSHPETVGEDDRLEIKVREAKDGKEVEGGFEKDGVYFNMSQIKNKTQRKKFIDKEVGAEFIVNFAKVFGSEEEVAKILGKDAPAGSDFNIIIDDAIRNEKPELDEEFFKKIFPDKEINDLDAFKKAVKAEMEKQHEAETDPILFNKMIDELVAAVKFDLPDAFMKRWIVDNSQGKISAEDIEKNYENDYVKGLRWQLIEDRLRHLGRRHEGQPRQDCRQLPQGRAASQRPQEPTRRHQDDRLPEGQDEHQLRRNHLCRLREEAGRGAESKINYGL